MLLPWCGTCPAGGPLITSAIPPAGTLNCTRISPISGSEPPGTPAMPLAVRMHSTKAMICCSVSSVTPKAWARNSTVTDSKSAVPLWFIEAESGNTKLDTSFGTPRSSSAHWIAVGSVALDELVLNAVSIVSRAFLKNSIGDIPPRNFTRSGSTRNWWIASPPSTVSTKAPSETSSV
ncbi:MAG: hypothetical protein U0791_05215 [Gemmataceae bacterium]